MIECVLCACRPLWLLYFLVIAGEVAVAFLFLTGVVNGRRIFGVDLDLKYEL